MRNRFKLRSVTLIVSGLILAGLVLVVIVLLTGPQVGSVFSAVTKGLGQSPSNPSANTAGTATSASGSLQPLPADRLIIRNATVTLVADDVDKTVSEIRGLANSRSGLVFQSSTTQRENRTYASLTLQVPAGGFDDIMAQLRRLSGVRVESENTTSQDVTEEYVDLQAQVKNLKATEAELTRLLDKAGNVGDVLNIQKELTNVRGEIERRQGRINYLDNKTALSSIALTIVPRAVPASDRPGWDPLAALNTAWESSLRGLQAVYVIVVTLAAWAVWLAPLAGLTWLVYRRFFRRKEVKFTRADQ